jgi:hypothetical protein
MAETLGSLCDKLTIVKLKQFHSEDKERLESLGTQEKMFIAEIDEFLSDAVTGIIPLNKLTFKANKVFKQQGNEISLIEGEIGVVFSKLAEVNCKLWHMQENVYDFSAVPVEKKDFIVNQLAILNLERNKCIDEIDKCLQMRIAGMKN